MIAKIVEYSARNKFLVLLLTAWAIVGGIYALRRIPVDAIPDLSDTQVIILSRWDRSPDILEDQVTYPIVTAMLGAPKVKTVRAFTDFGYSYVYVIFEDGTDIYWARSRTLEYLSKITPSLPQGVRTEMGPDATSVGWVFQYALVDDSQRLNLAQLRSLQDWFLRYQLQSVQGVAEVAPVGGFVKQYQVQVDPKALAAYNVPLTRVVNTIRESNDDTGGRLLEFSGTEFMVRAKGYAKSIEDLENVAVGRNPATGTPIYVRDVARVRLGPDLRRGTGELDGLGEAVGGIVIMRYGENALTVIERVKAKLNEIAPSLPQGVRLVTTYDRSELIRRAINTLKETLITETLMVSLVILFFLRHIPSALVPIVTIPISILLAFIPMLYMGITSNIMSLAGIAISIGVLVDGAIVEVENAYKKLEHWVTGGRKGDFHEVRLEALKEVGPSVFFSLLVIAVAFLPVFTLVDQEGRLFKPLAYSKTLAMALAALLAVTLDPAVRMIFTRMDYKHFKPRWLSNIFNAVTVGRYYEEEKHPVSKRLFAIYDPAVRWVLTYPKKTVGLALAAMLATIPVFFQLGSEFMPPLNEGSILYMPTAIPGMSITEAQRVLQIQDRILKNFPEVETVFGKAGRADTSTDPAPLSMVETTIVLKPKSQWRSKKIWGLIPRKITYEELINEMDAALKIPGIPNIWTMPIRNRIDMLSTGMRTPVGVKIFGPDLTVIQKLGEETENILRDVAGTRNVTAERTAQGYFIDIAFRRKDLARYGITIAEAEMIVASAIGGENITTILEGRERYGVNVRYASDYRNNIEKLRRVLVPAENGLQVPLAQLADIRATIGPSMIRDENGQLAGYVYVDIAGRDIGGYVQDAKRALRERLEMPAGYTHVFSGQYENMQRVKERLKIVIPVTLFLIVILLYFNTGSWISTGIVMLAVPFSAIGAIWILYLLGYNLSIAVWVGIIALMGLDAETGIFMLLYLDLAYKDRKGKGLLRSLEDLKEVILEGAVKRVRPKIMTVACDFAALLPIIWAAGTGADMMKRIAAPMVGGLLTSFLMELLVYPAVYYLWKKKELEY
ncbi:MAG: efflux RND transporter permease subunit [Elusimicrobia bacterium]|nr:efflux RND transporter permease subunit [Elusimicrobiota bacterium]